VRCERDQQDQGKKAARKDDPSLVLAYPGDHSSTIGSGVRNFD
jgi:hypothetical protein